MTAERTVLVTGAAGFIGMHWCRWLLDHGFTVTGIDNLIPYYSPRLKQLRLEQLAGRPGFTFIAGDITDPDCWRTAAAAGPVAEVWHLAAQAGVRHSLTNPDAYLNSNLLGFGRVLEFCRHQPVVNLVFASSSSVYGANKKVPFAEDDRTDHPVSLYAATKKANELMAHSYSHLYRLNTVGLRFFTVYGPWGRPDMAPILFADAICAGEPVPLFNGGDMQRDFTYIDDVIAGMAGLQSILPRERTGWCEVFNVGNNRPERLEDFVKLLAARLGRPASRRLLPGQPGDVPATYADVGKLRKACGYVPKTSLAKGIEQFVAWYREWRGEF
ncbi:MAG: NAD-dependent epimerase/dehydratase family protein [Negativicutes bacterium]|nr:NAD-dependent epimerase/dehydratase family protein [Negativicutes bacterium]